MVLNARFIQCAVLSKVEYRTCILDQCHDTVSATAVIRCRRKYVTY